jgi:tetratricopeptide (TPR) repeat protein
MYRPWEVNSSPLLFLLPWPGFALIISWAWMRRSTWGRPVLFGLGFFLLNLVPVLGFLPMSYMHITWVADHFAYLSLLAVAGLGAAGAGILWQRTKPARRGAAAALAALLVLTLAALSRADAAPFASNEVLWRRVLRLNPEAWMAHVDLGYELANSGHNEAAVEQYDQALRIRSDLPEAYYDRGSALLPLGRLPEAIGDFEESLRLQPGNPDALDNLGNALFRSGRPQEAIVRYQEALRIQPQAADIRANLIQALIGALHSSLAARPLTAQHLQDAFIACVEILRLDPDNVEAHADLGNLLSAQHRWPEAMAQYQEVLRLKPDDDATRANLDRAERALGGQAH